MKCLFSPPNRASDANGNLYEERLTIWQASTFEEAFALAEVEARAYATDDCQFVRAAQSFHLFDESAGHGSKVWSVMRGSHMELELYIATFCTTPRDRAAYSSSDLDESSPEISNA